LWGSLVHAGSEPLLNEFTVSACDRNLAAQHLSIIGAVAPAAGARSRASHSIRPVLPEM
jgi:hypothetical protein